MPYFLSPVLNEQQFDANGDPLAGGQIETYLAGTLTPVFTYKTESGTAHTNPIILDSAGYYPTGTQLWLLGGSQYKFIVKNSMGVTIRTIDNVTGINDSNLAPSEWIQYTSTAFTYLSPTSFSVVGDQTNIFQVNRRVQTTNTGGAAYGTVVSAIYGAPNTTVTLSNTSGALDAGLSAVYYALLSATNPSIPIIQTGQIADKAITLAKIQDIATNSFLGRVTAGTGVTEVLTASQAGSILPIRSGIAPIAASVASNALTLTLNPLTLDFRSTTAGNGAVTAIQLTSAITLTVSSGSTLGTTNGVLSKLAVLAINNAGTVELAVVNLAGSVNIGETGVISTTAEGGAGGADSATVIYSTTARTNVAYRIVGFVESTQATAGTWATAPSIVNGSSSPLAMWLAGYGQTWQNVTGSRSSGASYTNNTGRNIKAAITAGSGTSSSVITSIDGVERIRSSMSVGGGTFQANTYIDVADGSSISSTISPSIANWQELR